MDGLRIRKTASVGAGAMLLAAGGVGALGEPLDRVDTFGRDVGAVGNQGELTRRALELQRAAMTTPKDPALREAAESAIRQAIAAGELSPRRVLLSGVVEEMYGAPEATNRRATIRGAEFDGHMDRVRASNPHPWAGDIVFGEDFEWEGYTPHVSLSALSDFVPLHGQVAPNGNVWKTATTRNYNGLLDNATAQTGVDMPGGVPGSGYYGAPGGPDPTGVQGTFMASPRGSVYNLTSQAFDTSFQWVARLDHTYFVGTPTKPVATVIDWYMDSLETFTWFRPVASPEGCIATNLFMGGYDFGSFGSFKNDDSILDRPVFLAAKPGNFNEGEYYVGHHYLKPREWFQVSLRQGIDSMSLWIRDSETLGANPSGMAYDVPGYESEIYDTGWTQIFPGFDDDPMTPAIEGGGVSTNYYGAPADQFTMADGEIAGANFCTYGIEELQVVGGFDWPPAFVPGYRPTDWYFDNYSISGDPYTFPERRPKSVLPYLDDMELWTPGPFALQDAPLHDALSFSAIVEGVNHTPGLGADGTTANQAARVTNIFNQGAYRAAVDLDFDSTQLVARATNDKSLTVSSWMHLQDHSTSFGLDLSGDSGRVARVLLGARDGAGIVDDRLYLWLKNPAYDPDLPEADVPSLNTVWDGVANRQYIPAPLMHAIATPATIPSGAWFELTVECQVDPGEHRGDIQVYLDGAPLFIDVAHFASMGAVAPVTENSGGILLDSVTLECGYEIAGAGGRMWWDDIAIDGVEELGPTPLTVDGAPYSNQAPFTLPYEDTFSGYELGLPLGGQGTTPYLHYVSSGPDAQIDVIPLDAPIAPGDGVYLYQVESITDPAGLPPSVAPGALVAVANNLPETPFYPPGDTGSATDGRLRDASGAVMGSFRWMLQDEAPVAWDGATPVVGQYLFRYSRRWFSSSNVENINGEHPGHGQAVVLTQKAAFSRSGLGELYGALDGYLPVAHAKPGQPATMSFDLYIAGLDGQPLGRTAWTLRPVDESTYNGTALHAQFVFGGPNIYEDNLDNVTLEPTPDGRPDNMSPEYASDPHRLYVSELAASNTRNHTLPRTHDWTLTSTGYYVPVNQWLRAQFEIGTDLQWTLTIADAAGTTLFTQNGESIDSHVASPTIESLDIDFGYDEGGAGRAPTRPIVWESLGENATPEGPLDPHDGSFNSIPAEYFYFRVTSIVDQYSEMGTTILPLVTRVHPITGQAGDPTSLRRDDIVVFRNDTGTGSGSPTGIPLATTHPRTFDWEYSPDGGATVGAMGTWQALGLPGWDGVEDPVPNGGLGAAAPPYNTEPTFEPILMGSIIDLPPYPPARQPHTVMLDNLVIELGGCFMDLSGEGAVDAVDLAMLLASWGATGSPFDANSDDVIDGRDLAALLSAWGVCE